MRASALLLLRTSLQHTNEFVDSCTQILQGDSSQSDVSQTDRGFKFFNKVMIFFIFDITKGYFSSSKLDLIAEVLAVESTHNIVVSYSSRESELGGDFLMDSIFE